MFVFIVIMVVVAALVALPFLTMGASWFHWLGEKRSEEELRREGEELRRKKR